MEILYLIFVALFGVTVGSFLNVCIYRLPKKISISKGRSMCTSCNNTIKFYDLIPVLSYIILGGKCRNCKSKISFRYPLIEFLNALLWLITFLYFGFTIKSVIYCIFFSVLLILSMIDFDIQEIPNELQFCILILGVSSLFVDGFPVLFWDRIIAMFIISIPMAILTIVINGFGGGDIKLMFVAGFLLGTKSIILTMFIGSILASIYGIAYLIIKKERKQIPYGPFLSIGMFISIFFGTNIINWYLSFF